MQSVLERIEKLLISFVEDWQQYQGVTKPGVAAADEWLRADEVIELLSISQQRNVVKIMANVFKAV